MTKERVPQQGEPEAAIWSFARAIHDRLLGSMRWVSSVGAMKTADINDPKHLFIRANMHSGAKFLVSISYRPDSDAESLAETAEKRAEFEADPHLFGKIDEAERARDAMPASLTDVEREIWTVAFASTYLTTRYAPDAARQAYLVVTAFRELSHEHVANCEPRERSQRAANMLIVARGY